MKSILLFTLCYIAAAKADFLDDLGREYEFAKVKIAKWEESNLWEQFKLKLLDIQCGMGLQINPNAFLFISYIIVGILAFFVLKIALSILKCLYNQLLCVEPKEPTIVSVGHLRVMIPINDPNPYSHMV